MRRGSVAAAYSWLFLALFKIVQPQTRTLACKYPYISSCQQSTLSTGLGWALRPSGHARGRHYTGHEGTREAWKTGLPSSSQRVGTDVWTTISPPLCFHPLSLQLHSSHFDLHLSHLATLLDYSIFNSLSLINYKIPNFTTRRNQRSYFLATVILPFEC